MKSIPRAFIKTPIGFMELTGSETGIKHFNFLNFKVRIHRTPSCLKEAVDQLEEYFYGNRVAFTVPLDLSGTPFQLKVWTELQKIPYGSTASYMEIAKKLGNIQLLRAVGGANASNPLPIIIPCHRVIGLNGKLVGYAGGLKRKKWLLEHEHAFKQRDLFYG
jgi:methylated-DNA-[protein]-cysteine S-methyltransferase